MNDFFGIDEVTAGSPDGGVEVLNAVAAFGSLLLLAGVLAWSLVGWRRLQGPEAPADPWGGHTLEWATSPVSVTSERPLLDAAAVPDEGAS